MASTLKPVKLAELLQEQQEPFILEVYLFERGYLTKSSSTNSNSRITNGNSSKELTRSSSCGYLSCLRSAYKKLVSRHSETRSTKGCENREGESNGSAEKRRSSRESGESYRFSSASSRTQYDLCSEGEKESKEEVPVSSRNKHDASSLAADSTQISESCNMKEREIERLNGQSSKIYRKQQNPVSVPEDEPPHANASSPLYNRYKLHTMSREKETSCPSTYSLDKITEDSILSSSLWELLFHPPLEKPRASGISEKLEPVRSSINPSRHFAKSKRALQQRRQLLFNCVREMTENHAKKSKEQQQQHNCNGFLGAEEIGKLFYEKLGSWRGKQAGHKANVNFLLELDLLGTGEEWDDNYQERREIGSEIGDAILEEIIKEIVYEE